MPIFNNGSGAAVLVIEDDANTLQIIKDYLSRAGFRVHSATNGWEALKRSKEEGYELVVAESQMADTDGSRLREKFLLNPGMRETPFLFLIPSGHAEQHVLALRSGVDDCIGKPFDPIVLVARVQALLERRQAYEQFVRVDPLTRMLNRPTMKKEIEEELHRAQRYKRSLAMILLDLDGFARINEESGVATGDLLLTCFAGVVLSSVRQVDVAGRVRGEQFFLALPETDAEGALLLTRRLQERLNAIADVVSGYPLTFSAGVVMLPEHGDNLEVLQDRLELSLSFAKTQSRGTVSIWQDDMVAGAVSSHMAD